MNLKNLRLKESSMINLNMNVSPSNYSISQHKVEYSNEGKLIAGTTKDVFDKVGMSWKTKRDIVSNGLNRIRNAEKTTRDEKSVAQMGVNFGNDYMYNDQAANAMVSAVNTIASSMTGPIGVVLANTTLNAYSNHLDWKDARKILKEGLEKICANPNISSDEKSMANMGLDFGDDYMYNDQAARIQSAVVKTLANPPSGPIGQVFARTTINAYNSSSIEWKARRKIMEEGFDAIRENTGTSDDEKALAQMGLDFGDDYMYNDQAARIQSAVMEAIANPPSGTMAQILAKTTINAYNSGSIEWKARRKIMEEGFQVILNNPKSSETDKTQAQVGIDVGKGFMPDSEAAEMRSDIMQKIANHIA
ncbi:MAG: hypothetical protein AB2L14_04895 [Candidatus Xenobiia bacterium LiM19]